MFLATKTEGQAWSGAYRSDPCQIFRDSTTFDRLAPVHSPVQSYPIQLIHNNYLHHPLANGPIVIFHSMPDYSLSTSQRMVRLTVHNSFPAVKYRYEAEADSGLGLGPVQ